MRAIEINGRRIGASEPPYIIAEMSANHGGSLEHAKRVIHAARDAGASAIKLQTYRPDTITIKSDRPEFRIDSGLWSGRTLYDLYEEAHLPWEWHAPLFDYARGLGIGIFSSPFDSSAVDLLESLNAPAYKIASFELVDLPLIRYVAKTKKPMVMSTGMASMDEIEEALAVARDEGCDQVALLHCVSGYPASASEYNLRTLQDMQARFGTLVGLSDHTLDNATAIAAVAMGASIVEKHFTLDRSAGGPDDSFSLEPAALQRLCSDARTAWEALGEVTYSLASSEQGNIKFRRSLYFVEDVAKGELISKTVVRSIRPGFGLAPKFLDRVIGCRAARDLRRGEPVTWESIGTEAPAE